MSRTYRVLVAGISSLLLLWASPTAAGKKGKGGGDKGSCSVQCPNDGDTPDPAPYLYVTYHGGKAGDGVNVVEKYSRNGCCLGPAVDPSGANLALLRGMAVDGTKLLLANAYKDDSKIVRFGGCKDGVLSFEQVLVPPSQGLQHPYGVATYLGDVLYVTNQNSNNVQRFTISDGKPGAVTKAVNASVEVPVAGQFAQVETAGIDGVRGIAVVPESGLLFVANKQKGVMVYNATGELNVTLKVENPIGVTYCKDRNSVFVGSAEKDRIYEFDATTLERTGDKPLKSDDLKHPAGLVCEGDDTLYVLSQKTKSLLKFSLSTREAAVLRSDLPDDPEQLILTDLC